MTAGHVSRVQWIFGQDIRVRLARAKYIAAVWPAGPEPKTSLVNVYPHRTLEVKENLLTILLCIVLLRVCNSLDGLFLKLVAASAATQKDGALDLMVRRANVENSLAA